jgi:hypothetical protein
MAWGELALGLAARTLVPLVTRVWGFVSGRRFLSVRLEPINDPEMLRAFNVRLTNASTESLRLNYIFIRKPAGAELAVRHHAMIIILGDAPRYEPWERMARYSIDYTLDPGETYDCEIGIPQGFAISASRKPPVTIAVDMTTFGDRERRVIQDVRRSIIVG